MVRVITLTPAFAVAGQVTAADFSELAAHGFKSIISNRPDGEQADQLSAADSAGLAAAAGLQFRHLPLTMQDVLEPATEAATRDLLDTLPGPVLAFCRSGTRSAIAWAAAASTKAPVESVIDTLRQADFEIPGLASELRVRAALRDQPS